MKKKRTFKIGDRVRHSEYPEWKRGTIKAIDGDKALIRFPYRFHGTVWAYLTDLKKVKRNS